MKIQPTFVYLGGAGARQFPSLLVECPIKIRDFSKPFREDEMDLSLVFQLCGWLLVIGLVGAEVILLIAVGYLAFVAKRESLLQAFFPLTLVPVAIGLLNSFIGFVSGIEMQVDENSTDGLDPSFLLQMNLIPLLAGCIAALPAAGLCVASRFRLAWQSSGLRLIPEKPPVEDIEDEDFKERKRVARETDDYLERLVKAR